MPESRTGRRTLLGILVLGFALRAFKLTSLFPILVDESIYLRWAEIIDHQGQWFISLLDGKQPLQPWILALQRMTQPTAAVVSKIPKLPPVPRTRTPFRHTRREESPPAG